MEYGRENEQRTANNNKTKLIISKNATENILGLQKDYRKHMHHFTSKNHEYNNFPGLYLHVILLPGTLMDCMPLIALM